MVYDWNKYKFYNATDQNNRTKNTLVLIEI